MPNAYGRPARASILALAAVPALWAATVMALPATTDVRPQHWTRQSAAQLLGYVQRIDSHGLNPADYDRDALLWAVEYGDPAQLERQASESFGLVARDLANGHVRPAERRRFYIGTPPLEPADIAVLIDQALASQDISRTLDSLAPTDPQYTALRAALAKLAPAAVNERRKIEASLERWRWLPHELGARHLLVNIPEYQVRLMQDGKEIATHRVIVGKPSTPTPQFSTSVAGVIINPPWQVPQSIIAESIGKLVRNTPAAARARGFSWTSSKGRLSVTQGPGPGNALGQVKLDMPNGFTVYLHDTPSKELFEKPDRAFSHGCIRTDKALNLAAELLADSGWTRPKIDQAVAARATQRVALPQPVPVYVLYFTARANPDGTVRYFGDPYSLDGAIYDSLNRG